MLRLQRGWLILMLVLVCAGAPTGAALAAPPAPAADDLRFTYTGALDQLDDGALSLTLADGTALTFKLAASARVAWPGRPGALRAEVAAGVQVRVTVERATPQAEWQVVRVRVLDRPTAEGAGAAAPTVPSVAGVAQAYAAGNTVAVRQPDGGTVSYALTDQTRLLPAGRAQPPAQGDRVLLLFRRGQPGQVWAIVVLPNTRAAQDQ